MSRKTTKPEENALRSRLGRRIIARFLFIGIVPLLCFAVAIYYQSSDILRSSARATVIGYSVLARSDLFSTLEQARAKLRDIAGAEAGLYDPNALDRIHDISPFRRLIVIDSGSSLNDKDRKFPWARLSEDRLAFLKRDNITISKPYLIGDEMTVSLIVNRRHGGFIAGEMSPSELWKIAKAGIYGPKEFVVVIDGDARALASSNEMILPGMPVFGALPESTQDAGEGTVAGFAKALWGFSDLWLEGAFGGERWGIIVAQHHDALENVPFILLRSLLLLLALALCVIILLSFRQTREIVAPVLEMSVASQRISPDEVVSVTPSSSDELGDLARAFNQMSERLVASQREKTALAQEAMVGRLAATVAHQINTPLAAMRCKLEILASKTEGSSGMKVVLGQIDRIENIIRALLGFSRLRTQTNESAQLGRIVENVATLFRDSFETAGIRFDVELTDTEHILVPCSVDSFQELLVNLLENARDSCRTIKIESSSVVRHPSVSIHVSRDVTPGGMNRLKVQVRDSGAGLKEDPGKIFEPFVTSKIQGTGLGLAICKRICESASGEITAENRKDRPGAIFTAWFPLTKSAAQ